MRLLERVLKPLKEPYRGTIYLSGCYTSARLHDEEGIRGRSLLDEVALGLQDSKWATKRLAPEVQLVGYPGPEMQSASGAVAIEAVRAPRISKAQGPREDETERRRAIHRDQDRGQLGAPALAAEARLPDEQAHQEEPVIGFQLVRAARRAKPTNRSAPAD